MADIVYPQGCRPVTDDLGPDELVRRLKALAHTLQGLGQDEGMYQQYVPLALHLADDFFLTHPSRDVQLLIACCIADVLRVYAPEAPYKEQEQVKTIFLFLIKQLAGLRDPKDPAFKRYFYLLENLAYVKSFNMCFELEDCQEIFVALFGLMFKIVNAEHSTKVKSFMLDVLCPLITESDVVSTELLDTILCNLVEPAKRERKYAYALARDLLAKTQDTLEPYIQTFFNHTLILGKEDKSLSTAGKVYELIYELNACCPSVLLSVLPQLECKLKSAQLQERLSAVALLARMFSEPDSTLATRFPSLWRAFLGRFNDISVHIRIKCVQYCMHFLVAHPELRTDITETLKLRQHDAHEQGKKSRAPLVEPSQVLMLPESQRVETKPLGIPRARYSPAHDMITISSSPESICSPADLLPTPSSSVMPPPPEIISSPLLQRSRSGTVHSTRGGTVHCSTA